MDLMSPYYISTFDLNVLATVRNESQCASIHIYARDEVSEASFRLLQKIRLSPLGDTTSASCRDAGPQPRWTLKWSFNSGHLTVFNSTTNELFVISASYPSLDAQWEVSKIYDLSEQLHEARLSLHVRKMNYFKKTLYCQHFHFSI